jgi:hypothetical protein
MTAIEHRELKGITVKNIVVTVFSTASIVASVITTYCNLKTDIREVKLSQETETRINNIRIKVLEDQVMILQKQLADIKYSDKEILWPLENSTAKTGVHHTTKTAFTNR